MSKAGQTGEKPEGKGKRKATSFALDAELLHQFRLYCVNKGKTMTALLEQLIRQRLASANRKG